MMLGKIIYFIFTIFCFFQTLGLSNTKYCIIFAFGKVLHDQLPLNPPGLDRSKGN